MPLPHQLWYELMMVNIFKHHFDSEILNVCYYMLFKGIHCIRVVFKELGASSQTWYLEHCRSSAYGKQVSGAI